MDQFNEIKRKVDEWIMTPTKEELEQGRRRNHRIYGYFWSFCELNNCCENCDKFVRIGCVIKRKIEDVQTKRILKLCK